MAIEWEGGGEVNPYLSGAVFVESQSLSDDFDKVVVGETEDAEWHHIHD